MHQNFSSSMTPFVDLKKKPTLEAVPKFMIVMCICGICDPCVHEYMSLMSENYNIELMSYDHFSDGNRTIFQKLKMEKISFKVIATILIVSF